MNTAVSDNRLRIARTPDVDADHYSEHGYVVLRGIVPQTAIDALLDFYRKQIVPSRYPFFRQNTNAYEANKLSASGYVQQAFLDIHDYTRFPQFSTAARDIYCAPYMIEALRRVCGFESFALMQTMLFDMNTETPPHQDWYYLDSAPAGNLVAAWIALEHIDKRAGRFYVLPRSQSLDFEAKSGRSHAQWLAAIRSYVDRHSEQISAPELCAGDVLLWNSRTVHGSLPTQDPAYSRKSLTAHYLPTGFEFGNLFSVKSNLQYKQYAGVSYYRNQPDFSRWNRLKFAIKTRAYNYPLLRESLRTARDALRPKRTAPRK